LNLLGLQEPNPVFHGNTEPASIRRHTHMVRFIDEASPTIR